MGVEDIGDTPILSNIELYQLSPEGLLAHRAHIGDTLGDIGRQMATLRALQTTCLEQAIAASGVIRDRGIDTTQLERYLHPPAAESATFDSVAADAVA
jgi:hypothetical protein